MKRITSNFILGSLLATGFAIAEPQYPDLNYQWGYTISELRDEVVYDIAFAPDGSVFYCGAYGYTPIQGDSGLPPIDLDPTVGVDLHPQRGHGDIFVTKLAPDGTYEWTKSMGTSCWSDRYTSGSADSYRPSETAWGIALDSAGNIIVVGYFTTDASSGPVDLDPGPAVDAHYAHGYPHADFFTLKLDSNGDFVWVHTVGDWATDEAYDVAVDSFDNIYVAGNFTFDVDFDPDSVGTDLITTPNVYRAVFLTSYEPDGTYRYTVPYKAYNTDAYAVAVDPQDNVIVGGRFGGAICEFNPKGWPGGSDQIDPDSMDWYDIFVSKFKGAGPGFPQYYWTNAPPQLVANHEWCWSVATDSSSNVFASGTCTSDGQTITNLDPANQFGDVVEHWNDAAFLVKYGPDGSYTSGQGILIDNGPSRVTGRNVAVCPDGSVLLTGHAIVSAGGYVDLDPRGAHDNRYSATETWGLAFLAKYNNNLVYQWGATIGGPGEAYGRSVACSDSGDIIYGGMFSGAVDLNPLPAETDSKSAYPGSRDAYLVMLGNFVNGDLNCDGVINFADIDPFVAALLASPPDYASYYGSYPSCDLTLADCNNDQTVNFADIDAFVAILLS